MGRKVLIKICLNMLLDDIEYLLRDVKSKYTVQLYNTHTIP